MGLDMYINKTKRINGASLKDIMNLSLYFAYEHRSKEYKHDTFEEYTGISLHDVNANLIEAYRSEYIKRFGVYDEKKEYGYYELYQMIGYWRKANQIHNWFVQNIQNGKDDCECYELTKDNCEKLLELCIMVRDASELIEGDVYSYSSYENGKSVKHYEKGRVIKDPTVAKQLLPCVNGFFFGSDEYDEWYLKNICDTIECMRKILNTVDFDKEIVWYQASW